MNTESIVVTAFDLEHWDEVRVIYAEGIATGDATFETETPSWKAWNAGHLDAGRLVARQGRQMVGWAALLLRDHSAVPGFSSGMAPSVVLRGSAPMRPIWAEEWNGQILCRSTAVSPRHRTFPSWSKMPTSSNGSPTCPSTLYPLGSNGGHGRRRSISLWPV